jgi:hypothetical protein
MIDITAGMNAIAGNADVPAEAREVAANLARQSGTPTWREKSLPKNLVSPRDEFRAAFERHRDEGIERLRHSSVALVGLARNCDGPLYGNLHRALQLVEGCKAWTLHIETNDNTDRTDEVLEAFCREHPQASYRSQTLNRKQYGAEFSGRRTIALAEYRTACQRWVRENAAESDYVFVIDWDAWGGWTLDGVQNGIGWLVELQGAYAMASVSLAEMDIPGHGPQWIHYDAWALRLNSYWDDYVNNEGAWKHQWLPPVGSDPVRMCSAFGGLCIYKTDAYLAGTYRGEQDVEHATFHQSVAERTGQHMFLNPSQRMLMHWIPDGGQHSDN